MSEAASLRPPVLDIQDLRVELPGGADRRYAVEGVSLQVRPREIVCVVGESGSGKSVTAHSIMGLLPKGQLRPTGGRILLEGENLLEASEARLRALRGTRMGMIFQEPMTALNPVMTCGRQIDEVLCTHTRLDAAERRQKILHILSEVHLPESERMADSYPHQLSGGQRQRIMIAMALILEPALLIADEPTTALDVTTQAQILKLMKDLQTGQGHDTGVLFITHDFGVVAEIADRVVVMQWGKLVEQGTAEEVLRRPQHPYTRMLISSVPSLKPRHAAGRVTAPVVLRTEQLAKTYGRKGLFGGGRVVHAAEAVSLEIRKGETLGIVGESGSGKSTVARCIARLIDPTGGEIWLDRDPIGTLGTRQMRSHRQRIQVVFQDPYRSLNPRRTVGQSIVEGPMNFGQPFDQAWARARELMELVQLDPHALDRFPHQFSGGQRQRICIARALAMGPELLIADEAVSALDVSVQSQVLELLDDIRQKLDLAMLFITHDLRVAAQICDRIAVMKQGQVVEYGDAHAIFSNPQHPYTQALFEAAPGRGFEFGTFAA